MTSQSKSKPQITLNMKQDFLLRALSDKRFQRRGKVTLIDENDEVTRRVAFSAFDGAVLSSVVFHCNPKRGYSYIGCRAIAELMSSDPEQEGEQGWRTSPSGVAKSIDKLKLLGLLTEVGGNKKNKAQRLSPNWDVYLDSTVYTHEEDNSVHSHEGDANVHSHEGAAPSTPIEVDGKERKRTRKEAKGTGRASLARAASSPGRVGGARAPVIVPRPTV